MLPTSMEASAMEISRYKKWAAVSMKVHGQHSFMEAITRVVDGIRGKLMEASENCGS